jgi:hypothetical protein
MRSEQEIQLLERGPFPGRMDLWAEHEHFFHGLHEQFIGVLMADLRKPLLERGYVIGRETSLQIESLAEPGVLLDDLPKMTAVIIREAQSHQLVTVIEMISPSNKAHDYYIKSYMERREEIFLKQGVNVIEIDLTRSYKRLIDHPIMTTSPYHVAILIPGHGLRVVPMTLQESFKRIAMPLREDIIPIDLHRLYERTYQEMGLAALIEIEDRYSIDHLPFPSLLTDQQRDEALDAVLVWQDELGRVRQSSRQ